MKLFETRENGKKVIVLNGVWKIVFHGREELPRHREGFDFGADQIVITRWPTEDRGHFNYLLWHRACKYWADRMSGYVPAPAELRLHLHGADGLGRKIVEGGRLGQQVILSNADRLADLTGIPAEVWRWVVISGDMRKCTATIYKLDPRGIN